MNFTDEYDLVSGFVTCSDKISQCHVLLFPSLRALNIFMGFLAAAAIIFSLHTLHCIITIGL